MAEFLAVALSAAVGGFVQSVTGFGAAVVMMTVFPRYFGMTVAPSVSTGVCLGLSLALAVRFRRHLKLRLILLPTALYTVSSLLAIRWIGAMDLRRLTVAFGIFLILLGGWLLLPARGREFRGLAEGVATARSMLELSRQYGVELPICEAVCRAVCGGEAPGDVLAGLFLRDREREF